MKYFFTSYLVGSGISMHFDVDYDERIADKCELTIMFEDGQISDITVDYDTYIRLRNIKKIVFIQ